MVYLGEMQLCGPKIRNKFVNGILIKSMWWDIHLQWISCDIDKF